MWWRSPRPTTRPVTPRWSVRPSCSRFCAWWPMPILAPVIPRHRGPQRAEGSPARRGASARLLQAVRDVVLHQSVGDVILVDIGDVLHGLAPDAIGGDALDVVEPDVGIEAERACLGAQRADASAGSRRCC